MTSTATLGDIVAVMDRLFPQEGAEPGDPIGLTVGDPTAEVRRVLFAVDPAQRVVDSAISSGAQLLVTHHPLLFRAVHSVAADTPKGRVVSDLIRHGIGLLTAHTNADSAVGGVTESLALALGLLDLEPLRAAHVEPLDKVVTFVPSDGTEAMIDALAAAGAGALGNYDRCAFVSTGRGTFRPGPGSHPTLGVEGTIEAVDESRVEMVLPRGRRRAVIEALRAAHPYEEPAFDVLEMAALPAAVGTGRKGAFPEPCTLGAFAELVAAALPATASGIRVAGDLDATIRTVGVVGGAGDFMLETARQAGVDVFVTSDLRHHPASELREHRNAPALIDVPHWAAEWTWLPRAAEALARELSDRGAHITCEVSRLCTDPWNHRAASPDTKELP